MDVFADPGVVVDGETDLLAIEALRPLHVGDGYRHHFQRPIHDLLLCAFAREPGPGPPAQRKRRATSAHAAQRAGATPKLCWETLSAPRCAGRPRARPAGGRRG